MNKKILIAVFVMITILLSGYSIFTLMTSKQPSCAEITSPKPIDYKNIAKSDFNLREKALSTLLETLFLTLNEQNKSVFLAKISPDINTFVEIQHLQKYSDEEKKRAYENFLKNIGTAWSFLLEKGKGMGIQWEKTEYLQHAGMSDPNYAKQTLLFREKGKNYFFSVQLKRSESSGKWFIVRLGLLKPFNDPKEKRKVKGIPLSQRYQFTNEAVESGFRAVYFNLKTGKVGCSEIVNEINVHLGNKKQFVNNGEFCGIPKRELGAYFYGYLDFDKKQEKVLGVHYTHGAKVQVDIDEQPVIKTGFRTATYDFSADRHKIEVLYQPHLHGLHSAQFSLNLTEKQQKYSINELKQALPNIENNKLWYVSVYRSQGGTDEVVQIDLAPSSTPVILLLSSVDARKFVINNASKAKVKAVIFSGDDMATLNIPDKAETPIYRLLGAHAIAYTETLEITEEDSEKYKVRLINSIDRLFPHLSLLGFSGDHQTNTIEVPKIELSSSDYRNLKKRYCVAPISLP